MKKYFINCGGHDGCSARWFRDKIDKDSEYFIYTFEPDPRFKGCYGDLKKHKFYRKAVWIKDGRINFYLSIVPLANGSSLVKEKRTGNLDKENPIRVRCIDFSMWIKKTFEKEDYIFLKLDIEGAEYEVLEKMMKDGTLSYIDKLIISFHYNKIGIKDVAKKGMQDRFEERLKKYLKSPLEYWRFGQYSKYGKNIRTKI